ncbi:MAG: ATP-dependent sacrificial sulfur transferase LarE [Oscillospiraceae bacterium]|jgi:uncharacterized protein|nr:ATP-dependent sacrificial sulfur transferase LarE [Oscillospiraceae bacterium]
MKLHEKYAALRDALSALPNLLVAFSGGVDSTFLLKTAHDALGGRAAAVTASSCSFPKRELDAARAFCEKLGVRHFTVESEELDVPGFSDNPKNRCYLCKNELYNHIWQLAREQGFSYIAEGSNTDDEGDYRPGLLAVREQGVLSPLRSAGLGKGDIRALSRELDLETWDKPSFACLASRFPYGERLTQEKLTAVDRAEQLLLDLGVRQVRVRHHGLVARIETDDAGMTLLLDPFIRKNIYARFRELGFDYAALDLLGYRTGSMNEGLQPLSANFPRGGR